LEILKSLSPERGVPLRFDRGDVSTGRLTKVLKKFRRLLE